MKPRIGVTTTPGMMDDHLVELVNRAFVDAVVRAGGIPFGLPVLDTGDVETALLAVDGLLLSGGGDIDPTRYGALPVPEVFGIDPGRDAFEVALVLAAARAGLPVLGICRGCQVMNVALGGSLHQHVPALTGRNHFQKEFSLVPVHEVRVTPGTLLAGVVETTTVEVNSLHHQAVDRVGTGLQVVAWSDDGIAEGLESNVGARLLGVQWHPELLRDDPAEERLFSWLVAEAGRPLHAGIDRAADPAA
jgi:putative glutamine amidotransferase